MQIRYGILLNVLATVSAVQSRHLTRRMSSPSPPSPHPLREFDFNLFTQKGPETFFSLMDTLKENLEYRFVDVHDCLRDLAEENKMFRFMYITMVEGGAPPGYPIELIGKETYKCYEKVVAEMRSDEESSEEFSLGISEEASEEASEEGPSEEGPSEEEAGEEEPKA